MGEMVEARDKGSFCCFEFNANCKKHQHCYFPQNYQEACWDPPLMLVLNLSTSLTRFTTNWFALFCQKLAILISIQYLQQIWFGATLQLQSEADVR